MGRRHLGRNLKKAIVMVLTAALLASDNTILYAAEAIGDEAGMQSEDTAGSEAGTVSGGDAGAVSGEGEKESASGEDKGSSPGVDEKGDVSGGDAAEGAVSGGDAAEGAGPARGEDLESVSGGDAFPSEDLWAEPRLPEQFYEEEEREDYGTLVAYDEYSRTYHVDGNHYVTVVGNDGSTFLNEDGSLVPVDNTLEKETAGVYSMFGGQETGYVNRANDYTVLLPENPDLEAGRGITIANREAAVTLYPAEGSFRNGLAKDNAIRYSGVFPGVDYQYTVLGNSVKEDIILLERGERNSFSYYIDTWGLSWELKNNTLYLYEEGKDPEMEAAFVLEAPEMLDSAGEISFGVKLSVEEFPTGNVFFPLEEGRTGEGPEGLLRVTVTADESWLSAPERVYPVRIDPTAVQVTGSAIRMACAEEGSPNTAIGDNQYPYVGYDDGITSGNYAGFGSRHLNCRTYFSVDYDFAALSSEAEIVSAALQVTQKTRWSKGKSEFGLYGVEEAWSVKGLTWNNQLDYSHYFLNAQNASTVRGESLSFDVTEEVSAWINGTAENHGFVLKAQVEAPNREQAAAGVMMQCEVLYNNSSARYAPKLVLSWTGEPTDLDALSLDDTTVDIYPVVERSSGRSANTLGIVAHGLAKAGSTVTYCLINGTTGETEAQTSLVYPDSGLYAGAFPTALAYNRRLSNWQSEVFAGLTPGQVYYVTAQASLNGETGEEAVSDTFLIYREGAFDLIPRIALHYGVDVNEIMADMQMQDALTREGDLLFIRSPRNTSPYTAGELTGYYKSVIDGLLLGRAEDCEFGFEPVNLNTGNFYMEQTDAEIADIGGSFAFSRQYNSKGAGYKGSLGYGWSSTFDERLGIFSDGSILWLSGTGSVVAFTKAAEGYEGPAGYDYTLAEEGDGFVLTDRGTLVKRLFNAYGMLMAMEDIYGNRATFSYDMDHRLSAVTSPSGKNYTITLDGNNRILMLGLPDGSHISYAYDEAGNLSAVTDGAGYTRTYLYDGAHRMTAWYDENGNRVVQNTYDGESRVTEQMDAEGGKVILSYENDSTTAVDANGNITVYQHDGQFRTTGISYPDGTRESRAYDGSGHLSSVTDRQGVTTVYTYNGDGRLLTETRQDGAVKTYTYTEAGQPASVTEYDGGVTVYTYDERNRLTSMTDAEGGVVRYGYDEENRLTSVTDAEGGVTAYTYEGACVTAMTDAEGGLWNYGYDAMNRLTRIRDSKGNVSTKAYDAKGRCIRETDGAGNSTAYTFDAAGAVTAITDKEGQKSTFAYDKLNRLVSAVDPLGNNLSYTYDANGNRITETDPEGNVTSYAYDVMNRLKEEKDPEGGMTVYTYDGADRIASVTDRLRHTRLFSYDPVTGALVKETDARGNVTVYETDRMGRTTGIIHADGSTVSRAYDLLGRLTAVTDELGAAARISYDAKGNVVRLRDDEGRTYTCVYDRLNRLVKSTDPLEGTVLYAYDALGNLISSTDELGNTTAYSYDALGRLTAMTDALGGETVYTYDREGRVTSVTTPEGRRTVYTYDAIGQLTQVLDPSGNSVYYTYDKLSRVTALGDGEGSLWAYAYDRNGRLVKKTDALGNAHTYQVDAEGNLLTDIYPNGEKESYTYLATGEVSTYTDRYGVKTTLAYDAMGRVTEVSDTAGNRTTYEYNTAGDLLGQTDVLGRSTAYTYDASGRLSSFTDVDGAETNYAYDALDRLISVTDPGGNVTTYAYDGGGNLTGRILPGEAAWTYAYDVLNRLQSKIDPEGAVTVLAYDGDGNLTGLTDGNGVQTAYSYDTLSRLSAYTDGNGGQTLYTYDNRDNLTSITTPEGNKEQYGYDAAGNLLTVTDGLGETWRYEYDALYRLIGQTSPLGAEERYTYDRHDVVTEVTDALGSSTRYEVDANGRVVKKTLPNGGVYSYTYDGAHRLTGITTPLGYETVFTYSAGNDILKQEDSLGRTTIYAYDVLHNLISVTDPEGGVTSYGYDVRNNRTSMTNVLGAVFSYAYDRADRMITVTDPEEKAASVLYDKVGNIESISTPGGRTTRYGYDGNYNRTSVTDPMGYQYTYTYDKDDRLTGTEDPLGQTTGYTYDGAGRLVSSTDRRGLTERYAYDAHGNLVSRTDAYGLTTAYVYDLLDRLVSVTDPMGSRAFYSYDVMGNLTSATDYLGRGTQYTYDLLGNLTGVTDESGRTERMTYDAAGRITSYISKRDNVITYDYNKLDALVEKAYTEAKDGEGDASGTPAPESHAPVSYGYDALGERTAMSDSTGDTEYTYDTLGRITSVVTYRTPGKGEEGASRYSHEETKGDKVIYTYDGADNLTAITYPDGTRVSYEYDLNDNLVKVTDREGLTTTYVYDAINRIAEIHRPNGISTYNTYNGANQITELVNSCDHCGWVVSRYTYIYDERGFITGEKAAEALAEPAWSGGLEKHDKKSAFAYRTVETERSFTYDDAGKLLSVTETEKGCGTCVYTYKYDLMGNRTEAVRTNAAGKVVESRKYVYNENNQLSEAVVCDGKTTRRIQYTYDGDGNLTREYSPTDRSLTTYTYTVENRLEAVYTGTSYSRILQMAAAYDGDGNRVFQLNYNPEKDEDFSDYYCTYSPCDYKGTGIRLRAEGEVGPAERELLSLINASGAITDNSYELIEYINDVNREYTEVLAEQNINGTLDTAYVYGAATGTGSGRLSLDRLGSTGYYLYDPRGSVTGLTDGEGQLYQSYRYSAFGEITFGAPEHENEYAYNGESYNPNIRSQYLRARYYCVVTADFLTADEYLGNIMEPLTLNRYNYCVGNPLNYRDPSGNIPVMGVRAPAGLQSIYDGMQIMQEHEFPNKAFCEGILRNLEEGRKNWERDMAGLRSSGLGIISSLESAVYNLIEPVWVSGEHLKSIFTGRHSSLTELILEYEQMSDAEVYRIAAKAEDKTAFYTARCQSDVWIATISAAAANAGAGGVAKGTAALIAEGASGVGTVAIPGTVVYVAGNAVMVAGGVVLASGSTKTLAKDTQRLFEAAGEEAKGEGKKDSDLGNYKFKEGIDEDLRGGKGTFEEALEKAFEKTETPKEDFTVTKWGKDRYGKSHPVEWKASNGAEVNIDIGHSAQSGAPTADHVGWQTGGKRSSGGGVRGHIFVDEVPFSR